MMVDLTYHELALLLQLVNARFIELQTNDPSAETPFEAAFFKKLYDGLMDEMKVIRGEAVMRTSTEVSEYELILLIQLVKQHAILVTNDPSKSHLLAEGDLQAADLEFTSQLLHKLVARRDGDVKLKPYKR